MAIKIAINGFGRIGRNILRAHYEYGKKQGLQFVALNDLGDAKTNAHLLRHDTAHGPFGGSVEVDGDSLVVNGDRIKVLAERDPAKLPWKALGVDVVFECTGLFTSKAKTGAHLQAGAKKVIISAPGDKDVDRTIVIGVNDKDLKASDTVISNASCTTNCLAPLVKVPTAGIRSQVGGVVVPRGTSGAFDVWITKHKTEHRNGVDVAGIVEAGAPVAFLR